MSAHSNSCELSSRQLLGLDSSHVLVAGLGAGGANVELLAETTAAFKAMQLAAREDGIGLCVASGFRSFDRQLAIWNGKASGKRPCLDDRGRELNIVAMEPWYAVQAILRFSALPGLSRHHWGTDLDVFDEAAVAADYRLQLVAAEFCAGGPFAKLDQWLAVHAGHFGFFRPYERDRGGVAPEAWHLSYRPLASRFAGQLEPAVWRSAIETVDLELKDTVMQKLDHIFEHFVQIP